METVPLLSLSPNVEGDGRGTCCYGNCLRLSSLKVTEPLLRKLPRLPFPVATGDGGWAGRFLWPLKREINQANSLSLPEGTLIGAEPRPRFSSH